MAKGITLPIVFKSDTKGLKDAQVAVSGFEKQVSAVNKLLKTGMVAAATVATAAVGGLSFALTKGFGRLQDIENAEFKLRGLGHTAESVEQIMTDALSAVKGTAFGLGEAASIAASAVAAGVKPGQELSRFLTLTADAAAIAGTELGEMGGVLNKVVTIGKAQNDSLRVLAEKGIPIYAALAQQLGKTSEEIFAMATEGEISVEMLATALETTLGGAAKEMGGSLQGAFANTIAAIGRMGANLMKDVYPRFGEFFNALIEAMEPVEEMARTAGQAIGERLNPVFDDIIAVLPQLSAFLGGLGATLGEIRSRAGDVLTFFQPLIDAFARGLTLLPSLVPVVQALADFFGRLATEGLALFVEFGSKLIDSVLPVLIDAITKLAPPLLEIANTLLDLFLPVIETLANIALPIFVAILKIISPILITLATIVSNTGNSIFILGGIVFGAVKAFAAFKAIMLLVQAVQLGVAAASYGLAGATYAQTAASKLAFIATNLLNGTYLLQAGALLTNTVHLVASKAALIAQTVATNAAAVAQRLYNLAIAANPMGLLIAALAAVTAGLIWFFTNTEIGRKIIVGAFEAIKIAVEAFAIGFTNIFTKTIPIVFDFIKKLFSNWVNSLIWGFENWVNGIIKGVNFVIRALNRIQVSAPKWLTNLTGITSFGINISEIGSISLPRVALAEGGIVTGPTNALIGEAGAEAVIPLDKMPKGNTYNITVNAGMGADGNRLGEEIVRQITRFERLSGPVFARA